MDLSLIIPVYNEEESVGELHREVLAALAETGLSSEVIYIDDGSTDRSFRRLKKIAESDARVRVIRFTRNCGKSAAYMAGFEVSRGELVVTLDGDLQDDPGELKKLLGKLESRCDLVVGWKQGRAGNEPQKSLPSAVYNGIKSLLFGLDLHDSNCGFRAMRREVVDGLNLYGDRYRFIPELTHLRGYKVAEVPIRHRRRKYGKSKFGPIRFWTGILDLVSVRFLTQYGSKPLHFFGTVGLFPILIGGVLELYVLIQKLSGSTFQQHVAAIIIGVMLIVIGFQFLGIGLVCEMISAGMRRPVYHVRERIGFDD